jgi:acetyl esterase/lipase
MDPTNEMFRNQDLDYLHEPYAPEDILISGDSAGGGLTMALLNYLNMYLRDSRGNLILSLPRGAALLSPWVDLTCSSESWEKNEGLDFLPARANNIHEPINQSIQHPVYSYCFGEKDVTTAGFLSPVTTLYPSSSADTGMPSPIKTHLRVPSLVGLSGIALEKLRSLTPAQIEDQKWCESLGSKKRDALERMVRHPLISPIFGNFSSLPPILIVLKN